MTQRDVSTEAGFSLIELVAALSIFAVVAVIAQQSMFAAMAHSSKLEKHSAALAELELAVSLVTRDLENIAPRPVREGPEFQAALRLGSDGRDLEFTRAGLVDPTGRARNPFQRVRYVETLTTEHSERLTWMNPDRPVTQVPRKAPVWPGLGPLRFAVFADGQWHDTWPLPGETDLAQLPSGISVTFDTDRWGPIRRVVALE